MKSTGPSSSSISNGGPEGLAGGGGVTELPSRVAQWYYKHGLFLSSYPTCAAAFGLAVTLFCCYPLLNIPLPGTIPTKVVLPSNQSWTPNSFFSFANLSLEPSFTWARVEPYVYVQQVVLKAAVVPWEEDLQLTDAFRGPLHEVFKLLEIVRNHEAPGLTLSDICLHVENVKGSAIFPEYNCLVLSPASFWQQSPYDFNKDPHLLTTIFQHHNFQKSKVSTAEMLFGMPLKNTGLKRYPMRGRQRTIQFAMTLFLKEHNQAFVDSLREKLAVAYPLHQTPGESKAASILYIYYPSEFNLVEFGPLCIAFVLIFIYVYLTVRKIDAIRSRFVLALASVVTVAGSLLMSLGFCFFFGLTIGMQSRGVYPYLVLLVGLENSLVLTKSVVTTDENLDVKIRLAQGLSKEGWSISKNLLTEITILTIGLATFIPVIQEFCIFAIVGLIADFFLQMLLFSTCLGLDIKRVEYSAEVKQKMLSTPSTLGPSYLIYPRTTIIRSRSHPKLTAMDCKAEKAEKRIPKRLRVVNFWARTRFFQRGFMIWMVLWISNIIYNSGLIEQLFYIETNSSSPMKVGRTTLSERIEYVSMPTTVPPKVMAQSSDYEDQLARLKHPELFDMNYHLSSFHWSSILKQYNISISGQYVTVLPTIRLSHAVPPDVARHLRNPAEKPPEHFQWKALAVALDPLDFNDAEPQDTPPSPGNTPLYPKTPMEILLTSILAAVSVFALSYAFVVLYRCICSRNYAEWRASWNDHDPPAPKTAAEKILDGVPVQVNGHKSRIECLVTDGQLFASSCLEALVRIWDATTGQQVAQIDRAQYFEALGLERANFSGTPSSGSLSESPPEGQRPVQMQTRTKVHFDPATTPDTDAAYLQLRPQSGVLNRKQPLVLNGGWFHPPVQRSQSLKRASDPEAMRRDYSLSPIWCLDFQDNLIVIGCADGRLEFWEGTTGAFKCIYETETTHDNGVTSIKLAGDRVVATRLNGRVDFLRLETYTQGRHIDWGFTSAYRRTHVRTGSAGSIGAMHGHAPGSAGQEELRCILAAQCTGHQQPITCLDVVASTVLTGSQDHTLKVFRLETSSLLYTLHGHCGPITSVFIDRYQSGTGGSGSQDGLLCVWDLITGACMYKIQAHDDAIASLACSPSYIISLGLDERLRIWERFQGHLLNTINVMHPYSQLLMLTPSLLVTARPGSLVVWDVRSGEPVHEVKLDHANRQLCPKIMLPACNAVICDYGAQLRIVKFPLAAIDKCE